MNLGRRKTKTRQRPTLEEETRIPHHEDSVIRAVGQLSRVCNLCAHSCTPSMILIATIGLPVVAIQRFTASAHLVAVLVHFVEATMSPEAMQAK
jgi:hypothetical protein